ncbi:sensor histidine kinase [Pontibacter akesuensis]|uniref:histidine kinase n=1 Tax=Pontibacter akesuensis TaxID=388950 RepID=A0A1I7JC94_9BACT|nr:sensor histidine kinase [Pontibacter akesuensis]GHA71043.1 histidine kinase [Pontibacter akesuensis]SFU82786.1 Histidine kinase-, DNA gyrase B-, and HSP90-like ATPase [Pontibacter akesuensis]
MEATEQKIKDGIYNIRPAGRHILTIGRDLIKDVYAALIELVKNSYDADANNVIISFSAFPDPEQKPDEPDKKKLKIMVSDDGHGMSYETVTEKWMVPSTNDKEIRKTSPNGRHFQGRKGIGRYAVSMLGDELLLDTVTTSGERTTLVILWNEFLKNKFLSDVPVLIESFNSSRDQGTFLEIIGTSDQLYVWNRTEIEKLIGELKKLISPIEKFEKHEKFDITVKFKDFIVPEYENIEIKIEPYPLVKLYDYRISGNISATGDATLIFENDSTLGVPDESLNFKINIQPYNAYCGPVSLDLRVFDREPEAIQNLIDRGLKNPTTNQPLGRREARHLLSQYSGIGIYRKGFRIRPHGDAGYDWLLLDKRRVQNPSLRIGSDQVIGFISVEPEEISHLEEKSARDGLRENKYYHGLIDVVNSVLSELESRRYYYRYKTGKGRNKNNVEEALESFADLSLLRLEVDKELDISGIKQESRTRIGQIIRKKEEENQKTASLLRNTIAIYQGQATLGKIINVVLHEGRKPVSYFRNVGYLMSSWSDELREKFDPQILDELQQELKEVNQNSKILADLFSKIDPLASKRRENKAKFNLLSLINSVLKIFNSQIKENNISVLVNCDQSIELLAWKDDFYIVFTNLLENSIHWLISNSVTEKEIKIDVSEQFENILIDLTDNGPGIEEKFIESGAIFEPGFTTKPDGSGLGLAIAGEAMNRNNYSLEALYSKKGVHFQIKNK